MSIMRDESGKLKMLIALILAVVILLAGIAIILTRGSKKEGKQEKVEEPVELVALGEFVVNLADVNEVRYVKTTIVLGVQGHMPAGGGGGHGGGEDNSKAPIRDAIIEVIHKRTFAELAKPGGTELLKKDIIKAVNEHFKHDKETHDTKVAKVYFNDFAMQ